MITPEEARQFMIENDPWLRKWLTCTKPSRAKRPQWFKTDRAILWGLYRPPFSNSKEVLRKVEKDVLEEQIDKVLCALVFGTRRRMVNGSSQRCDCISGFYEQTGRLPKKRDKVLLRIVDGDFTVSSNHDTVISTVAIARLQIL